MNLRVDVFLGNYHECGKDGEEGNTNLLFAQYGLQEDIKDEWKNIISIDESKRFMMEIDNLVNKMESNSKKNGFFDFKQNINTESLAGFKLDDKDLYYLFFVNLKLWNEKANKAGKTNVDGTIIFNAIKQTVNEYLGEIKSNARNTRRKLTQVDFVVDENGNDQFVYPSIKEQKNRGSGICTERAAISHNLWLLAGRESYFVTSNDCQFNVSNDQYINDGHSFTIVKTGSKYKMCDLVMNQFSEVKENPIELIKRKRPLVVENDVYFGKYWQKTSEKESL